MICEQGLPAKPAGACTVVQCTVMTPTAPSAQERAVAIIGALLLFFAGLHVALAILIVALYVLFPSLKWL